jgi:hypothetical protein
VFKTPVLSKKKEGVGRRKEEKILSWSFQKEPHPADNLTLSQ